MASVVSVNRAQESRARKPRSRGVRAVLVFIAALLFCILIGLGTWQVERRTWKLDLIERVTARVKASASPAPSRDQWPAVNAAADEYRHVAVTGTFRHSSEALVQAVTDLGPGFWVLTPMRLADGSVVMVNRGYVPQEHKERSAHGVTDSGDATTPVSVTGLLRITEPGGGFLRHNDPAADRWYSRDVQAIAAARGLHDVAPYFIDAEAAPPSQDARSDVAPVGGLTIVSFHNSHLIYAVTWYVLAVMMVFAGWRVWREDGADAALTERNDKGQDKAIDGGPAGG